VIRLDAVREWPADLSRHSPNWSVRPSGASISCVVIHATADEGDEAGAESWLCARDSQASAHLLIRRDGQVVRLVPDKSRAWHAGVSAFRGCSDVNDFSLGWELCNRNDGREPFTDAQYEIVARIAAHYIAQGLGFPEFAGHDEVALPPGRKTDPRGFDWTRFVKATLVRCASGVDGLPSGMIKLR
jgi:N-acetyl-anhydromuramyl-L-alanine amidase AmpD